VLPIRASLSATDAALDVVLSESHNPVRIIYHHAYMILSFLFTWNQGVFSVCVFSQLYGARPVRRWLQKNVMTRLSEMLVRGEVDADTTVIIDATEDKKDLKYEVVKNSAMSASQHRHGKMPMVEEDPSDADSDDDITCLDAPAAKEIMKGIVISSPGN
jgi:ATP-dependent Clp protease ATP-binding subunit ClpB